MFFDENIDISIIMTNGKEEIVFNGRNAIVTDISIDDNNNHEEFRFLGDGKLMYMPTVRDIEINLKMSAVDHEGKSNWEQIFFDDTYQKTVREKLVDDCTIEELLFACKRKMEIRKNGKED